MSHRDKICGLVFDAISIKRNIHYNINKDKFDDLEDLGMYGRANVSANYAMMFMVKGLASKWKQPLGYFFFTKYKA